MKKFDFEAAKNGAAVVDGFEQDVRILSFDIKGDYPIVAIFKTDDTERCSSLKKDTVALFMKEN